jgi:hypothetical protein
MSDDDTVVTDQDLPDEVRHTYSPREASGILEPVQFREP